MKGTGDVHEHVQEPLHVTTLLSLFNLKLGEKGDEPLEGPLLPVDPEEVHLPQVHHLRLEVICPTVGTLWTCISSSPIPVHDGLKYGCKGSDSYSRSNENCMLRMKYQIGGSPKRTIDEDLEGVVDLTDIRAF